MITPRCSHPQIPILYRVPQSKLLPTSEGPLPPIPVDAGFVYATRTTSGIRDVSLVKDAVFGTTGHCTVAGLSAHNGPISLRRLRRCPRSLDPAVFAYGCLDSDEPLNLSPYVPPSIGRRLLGPFPSWGWSVGLVMTVAPRKYDPNSRMYVCIQHLGHVRRAAIVPSLATMYEAEDV